MSTNFEKEFTDEIGAVDTFSHVLARLKELSDILGGLDSKLRVITIIRTFLGLLGAQDTKVASLVEGVFMWTWKKHPKLKVEREDV